jgi:hypothetical protein
MCKGATDRIQYDTVAVKSFLDLRKFCDLKFITKAVVKTSY